MQKIDDEFVTSMLQVSRVNKVAGILCAVDESRDFLAVHKTSFYRPRRI
jgi:hypothetical protein